MWVLSTVCMCVCACCRISGGHGGVCVHVCVCVSGIEGKGRRGGDALVPAWLELSSQRKSIQQHTQTHTHTHTHTHTQSYSGNPTLARICQGGQVESHQLAGAPRVTSFPPPSSPPLSSSPVRQNDPEKYKRESISGIIKAPISRRWFWQLNVQRSLYRLHVVVARAALSCQMTVWCGGLYQRASEEEIRHSQLRSVHIQKVCDIPLQVLFTW